MPQTPPTGHTSKMTSSQKRGEKGDSIHSRSKTNEASHVTSGASHVTSHVTSGASHVTNDDITDNKDTGDKKT